MFTSRHATRLVQTAFTEMKRQEERERREQVDWLLQRELPSPLEPLLTNQAAERYTRGALYQAMLRLGRAAGITRKVNLHSVRHLYNTTARDLGIDRETRARLLNHGDTRTLQE